MSALLKEQEKLANRGRGGVRKIKKVYKGGRTLSWGGKNWQTGGTIYCLAGGMEVI